MLFDPLEAGFVMRAVITGTSSGIGLSTAIAFARAGHAVHATLRDPGRAGPLREAAERASVTVEIGSLDVGDAASCRTFFDGLRAKGAAVDVLVNNAGIGGASPLELVPEAEHREVFETNYWGAVRCSQAVLPGMRERGHGAIVNVSSVAGLVAMPNQIPYCASKWALEAMSESLAYELRPFGVRVALVETGVVATRLSENSADRTRYDRASPYKSVMQRAGWLFRAGLRDPGSADEVAAVILEAATGEPATLRHFVGEDVAKIAAGRRRISDEDFLALSTLDDEGYKARYAEIFGIEL